MIDRPRLGKCEHPCTKLIGPRAPRRGFEGRAQMDVSEILIEALAAVDKAKVPAELRSVALREAIRLLAPGGATGPTVQNKAPEAPRTAGGARRGGGARRARPGQDATAETPADAAVGADAFFDKVASETGIARAKLERVFNLDGGKPRINLTARLLGSSTKQRMVTVAQLISMARLYGLDEVETSTGVVREECSRLKCLDSANLNAYLSNVECLTYFGSRNDRRLKVRAGGTEVFAKTVDRVLQEPAEPAS